MAGAGLAQAQCICLLHSVAHTCEHGALGPRPKGLGLRLWDWTAASPCQPHWPLGLSIHPPVLLDPKLLRMQGWAVRDAQCSSTRLLRLALQWLHSELLLHMWSLGFMQFGNHLAF
jgi:hypothetical protein